MSAPLPYGLKGTTKRIDIFTASEGFEHKGKLDILATTGGFTLPLNDKGELALSRRDNKPGLAYAGWWNCFGGGAEDDEGSIDLTIGREFLEESLCQLGQIVGRVGRPLRAVLQTPKMVGDPVTVDMAEAHLVKFTGEPKLTDENREWAWFDWDRIRAEEQIVGRDTTPLGRTFRFVQWGISLGRQPFYEGRILRWMIDALNANSKKPVRLTASPNFVLLDEDRYLAHVTLQDDGTRRIRIWHSLSIEATTSDGIIPGVLDSRLN